MILCHNTKSRPMSDNEHALSPRIMARLSCRWVLGQLMVAAALLEASARSHPAPRIEGVYAYIYEGVCSRGLGNVTLQRNAACRSFSNETLRVALCAVLVGLRSLEGTPHLVQFNPTVPFPVRMPSQMASMNIQQTV